MPVKKTKKKSVKRVSKVSGLKLTKDEEELVKGKRELAKAFKSECCDKKYKYGCKTAKGCGGCAYFLGFIGAACYYISASTGFWNGVLGFLKAIVWPAFLVFEALKFFGMQ